MPVSEETRELFEELYQKPLQEDEITSIVLNLSTFFSLLNKKQAEIEGLLPTQLNDEPLPSDSQLSSPKINS
jgi:hypothetical protein